MAKLAAGGQGFYVEQARGRVQHRDSVAWGVEDYLLAGPEAVGCPDPCDRKVVG